MLMVRLQRVGRKHEPVFRLVLTDSKNGPKSGKFLEILGSYDARRSEKAVIKDDRIKYWIANGAQLSGTIHNLLVERKVIEGKKINVLPLKKPIVTEKEDGQPSQTAASAPEETTEKEAETPKPEAAEEVNQEASTDTGPEVKPEVTEEKKVSPE
jgi:small subunit ribosomal protein S16